MKMNKWFSRKLGPAAPVPLVIAMLLAVLVGSTLGPASPAMAEPVEQAGWRFDYPTDIAVGQTGIYVADGGVQTVAGELQVVNPRIMQFTIGEFLKFLRQWGSFGNRQGQFYELRAIALDKDNAYAVDSMRRKVLRFTHQGQFLGEWGDNLLVYPFDIAISPREGTVYVVDGGDFTIKNFDGNGRLLNEWGSFGNRPGQFVCCASLDVASNGNVYVADTNNHRIQVFNAKGRFLRTWQLPDRSPIFGPPPPDSIAVSADGRTIFVGSTLNGKVFKYSSTGRLLGEFDSGPCEGIDIAPSGDVYCADPWYTTVRWFAADGTWQGQFTPYYRYRRAF